VIDLAYLVIFLIIALGAGNGILCLCRASFREPRQRVIFSFGLGLGVLGYSVFLIGMLGMLHTRMLYWVFGCALLFCAWPAIRACKACRAPSQGDVTEAGSSLGWIRPMAYAVVALVVFVTFLKTLTPPIENDVLNYHLDLPKRFLAAQAIFYDPHVPASAFPLLMHMFYLAGLALRSPIMSQQFHWFLSILAAITVYDMSKQWLGGSWSLLSAALFLSVPGIMHQMPVAQNDVAVVLFQVLMVYASFLWIKERRIQWAILAGCFAGLSLSVKLTSIAGCGACFLTCVTFMKYKSFRKDSFHLALFGLFALFACAAWYLRAVYYTGNPVYPYFPTLFGGEGLGYNLAKHGLGKAWLDFLIAPWRMTVNPGAFGGRGNQFGPLFLALLPFLLFLNRSTLKQPIRFLSSYAGIYFVVWFIGPQNLRFLFPILPALSILVVMALYLAGQQKRRQLHT